MFADPIKYIDIDGNAKMLEDFIGTTVKGAYDSFPEIKYPLVTILEIQNTENDRFTDNNGEHVSNLSYQIEAYSRDTLELQATDSAMLMSRKINELLTGPTYKLRRVGNPSIAPLVDDKNVIRSITRYACSLDLDNNIIYSKS